MIIQLTILPYTRSERSVVIVKDNTRSYWTKLEPGIDFAIDRVKKSQKKKRIEKGQWVREESIEVHKSEKRGRKKRKRGKRKEKKKPDEKDSKDFCYLT